MSWANRLSLRIHPYNIVSSETFLLDLMKMKKKNLMAKKETLPSNKPPGCDVTTAQLWLQKKNKKPSSTDAETR